MSTLKRHYSTMAFTDRQRPYCGDTRGKLATSYKTNVTCERCKHLLAVDECYPAAKALLSYAYEDREDEHTEALAVALMVDYVDVNHSDPVRVLKYAYRRWRDSE